MFVCLFNYPASVLPTGPIGKPTREQILTSGLSGYEPDMCPSSTIKGQLWPPQRASATNPGPPLHQSHALMNLERTSQPAARLAPFYQTEFQQINKYATKRVLFCSLCSTSKLAGITSNVLVWFGLVWFIHCQKSFQRAQEAKPTREQF